MKFMITLSLYQSTFEALHSARCVINFAMDCTHRRLELPDSAGNYLNSAGNSAGKCEKPCGGACHYDHFIALSLLIHI